MQGGSSSIIIYLSQESRLLLHSVGEAAVHSTRPKICGNGRGDSGVAEQSVPQEFEGNSLLTDFSIEFQQIHWHPEHHKGLVAEPVGC